MAGQLRNNASPKRVRTKPRSHAHTPIDPPNSVESLARVEYAMGGREKLLEALILAPQSETLDRFIKLACAQRSLSPKHKPDVQNSKKLAQLCREADCYPRDVFKWVEQGKAAEAHALEMIQVHQESPNIVGDVLRKAQPHQAICEGCASRGYTFKVTRDKQTKQITLQQIPCAACGGEGWTAREAVSADVDRALDMAGLVSKGGGIQVTQQTLTLQAGSPGSSLVQLQRAVDQILHGDAFSSDHAAIEAESVEAVAVPTLPASTSVPSGSSPIAPVARSLYPAAEAEAEVLL